MAVNRQAVEAAQALGWLLNVKYGGSSQLLAEALATLPKLCLAQLIEMVNRLQEEKPCQIRART